MSREIKFRVWGKEEKKYYYDCGLIYNEIMVNFDGDGMDIVDDINVQEDYILEQYTGLTDKNGVEIYEGDIVKFGNESYVVHYNVKTLSFDLKDFDERNQCPLYYLSKCEVIGNIHEGVDKDGRV